MTQKPNRPDRKTQAAQALHFIDPQTGAITPPVHPSTTFARRAEDYQLIGSTDYTRYTNPTYDQGEALLAELEEGAGALVFASGLAASAAAVMALKPGDHLVVHRTIYWGFRDWLESFCPEWGIDLELIDASDLGAVEAALRPGDTKLLWVESPTNPLWETLDLAALAERAHSAGAKLAVDNTCATPVLTQPITLGADLVMHSATKYLNGHSDVLAGALITAQEDEFWDRVWTNRAKVGAVLGPFEAWLLLRGLRTLFLRVERQSANALAIARHFEGHPMVERVRYPGLESDPGHAIAAKQMEGGFGGMLGLEVKGGFEEALAVCKRANVWLRATSLGGVESLIEHRKSIEGEKSGCPDK